MQLTDLLVGAICHYNRNELDYWPKNAGKQAVLNESLKLEPQFAKKRTTSSLKTNIFFWEPNYDAGP